MGRLALLSVTGLLLMCCNGSVTSSREESASTSVSAVSLKQAAAQRDEERKAHVARLRRSLEPVLSRKKAGLHEHLSPQGRVIVPLEGRFGHAMMARRGADGRLEYGCFDNAARAVNFVEESANEVAK